MHNRCHILTPFQSLGGISSLTQIRITCFTPHLQPAERTPTICRIRISLSLIFPSLVHGHYHQIILFLTQRKTYKELASCCSQLENCPSLPSCTFSWTPEILSPISLSWPSCSIPGNFFMAPLTELLILGRNVHLPNTKTWPHATSRRCKQHAPSL